jgi:LAO/AO transport system kinase
MLPDLATLQTGDKRAIARALAAIETEAESEPLAALLDAACADARAHVIGLTGPPGVGKSTLTNALLARARARGETVGVIAVDPSSRRSGGALLGDRARIATDPEDRGVFVRSMAARDRLGGLSDQTVAAMVLMRAIYDLVLIESVGIGQSEADISFVADTVLLCVQPGSGDSLQFMKAGVTELPDVVAVTKADMEVARRTRADVEGALTLYSSERRAPVLLISTARGEGLEELERALMDHHAWLMEGKRLVLKRHTQQELWIEQAIRARFGSIGLRAMKREMSRNDGPFSREHAISKELSRRLGL